MLSGVLLQAEEYDSPLGMPIEITDVYIAGPEVEPIPRTDQSSSLVIRILKVKAAEDGFRYDLSIYGLDPGVYKISDFLQYKDTENPVRSDLATTLKITNQHPIDELPKPEEIEHRLKDRLGGYRASLIVISIFWVVGLLLLLFYRKQKQAESDRSEAELTLHEKLQQLVGAAATGKLDEQGQAQLERLIIGHWKTELPELNSIPATEALAQLRNHPEASPLILKIEQWLHASHRGEVDLDEINEMLKPFQSLEVAS